MYINNFDYLRHFAALMVLVSHALPIYGVEYEPQYQGVNAGSLAVCIFFVLSGFLINGATERNTKTRFVIDRILRLYPAAIACILITVLFFGPIYTTLPISDYFSSIETYGYLRNSSLVLLFQDKLPGLFSNNPLPFAVNGSLWTLPIEIRAYVFAALVTFFSKAKKMATLCVFMMFLLLFYHQKLTGSVDPSILLYLSFFSGGCLYQFKLLNKGRVVTGGLILIFLANHFLTGSIDFILWVVAFSIVYVLASFKQLKRLSFDFSYGIYIYAFPVSQCFVFYQISSFISYLVLVTVVTLIFSMLSWYLIEKPVLRFKYNLRQ